jgi:ATP-dependent Clp protease adaptor protein ClpS
MTREKIQTRKKSKHCNDEMKCLILHNDDHNLFEFVITSLVEVCAHTFEQAEQCALIAHFKGSCEIKNGTLNELEMYHKELAFRDLTVSIE